MMKLFKHNTFTIFYGVVLCVICFTPIVQYYLSNLWTAILWGGFVMCFLTKILGYDNVALNQIRNLWLVYLVIILMYIVLGFSEGSVWGIMPDIITIIPLFLYCVITHDCDDNQIHSLFHIFCLIIALNIADSIRICILNPYQITYQSLSDELEMQGITGLNIGGTAFLNSTIFFLNIVLIAFFNTDNKFEKTIFGIYAILTLIFDIAISLKASIVLIAILSVILQYIAHRSENFKKAFGITAIVFVFLYIFKNFLLHSLVDIIGSDRIAVRLLSFTSDSEGEGDISTFTGRSDLWLVSIKTWLTNLITFIFGIGNKTILEGQSAAVTGIGNHSDFFDVLAKYGLFGTLVLYGVFIRLFKYYRTISQGENNAIIGFVVIVLSMAISKKILFPQCGFLFFCLMPICLRIYKSRPSVTI